MQIPFFYQSIWYHFSLLIVGVNKKIKISGWDKANVSAFDLVSDDAFVLLSSNAAYNKQFYQS